MEKILDDMSSNPKNIDELIIALNKIKDAHGNLPIITEYDASYRIGINAYVSMENNPDSYSSPMIKAVFLG